ncbi:acyl carrier protein [Streptomyces sp. NPDC048197]|uniref:acyl carrier protein n=1 Tax=Streptomyces sp. NPDC048197 TaxID=3365511 RepID=UPI00371120AF
MQAIELLFAVEDTFGISLPDEELNDTTFATAGSLWNVIAAQLPQGTGDVPAGQETA